MNILLLGSGGREHAIAWKLSQSNACDNLFIAPGNAGTSSLGTNVTLNLNDFESIADFCTSNDINLLIIGPEEPLVKGLVDHLKTNPSLNKLLVVGPSKEATQLEGSKAYAKSFMQRHGIPTAAYREFTKEHIKDGIEYLHNHELPIVLKADGLAAGKGVIICSSHMQAIEELEAMLEDAKFGEAGSKVVVEQFLDGIELSVFVLTDGKNYVLLPEAKDYKRIGEGDTGLNTGGMGAVSPVPFADETFMQKVISKIIEPTIKGLSRDGLDYHGFVFFGLIKVGEEPMVIEYNCRMGDPETEVVMPRIKSDLVDLLVATAKGELENVRVVKEERCAVTVMAVSGGYPGSYRTGQEITGLDNSEKDVIIFHAGTRMKGDHVVTAGGRVLCATALAPSIEIAVQRSLASVEAIKFEGKYYRKDIGYEFI